MPATRTAKQQSNPFIKQLASSNRKIRDSALTSLRTYLQRSTPFSELDFLKLWKGLFFCMWMSDKPLTQQRLARDLADLLHVLRGKENFLRFVDAFWKTIAREWGGIDALRMDKFLYLVRCYINQGFERVSKQQWSNEALLGEYLKILESVPLNARDAKIPNGLRYHVIDLYVDELDKVDTKRTAPLEEIIAPLRRLGKTSLTKAVRERVREALDDERLNDWQAVEVEDDAEGAKNTTNEDTSKHAGKLSAMDEADNDEEKEEEDDNDDEGGFTGFGD